MRLHRLEVEGFGPFRERQVVDFDAFADDGIFLIAGRTGAGKSSILDAVCFGLYGGVPRYDAGEKRLRSDHCKPDDLSEVVVEFSTPAGRFRVTRSPEYLRPAKRGGGLTKQAAAVALEERTDAGWVGRAARAVDVGNELAEILQLTKEQFLQVILLAQNRFSEFLLAGSKERQALLRRLFGTERFEDVQSRFEERRRTAESALGARLATVTARLEEAEALVTAEALWSAADGAGPDGGDSGGVSDGSLDETADGDADADRGTGGHRETDGVQAAAAASAATDAARATRTSRARTGGPAGPGGTTEERLEALHRALARAQYRAERRAAEKDDAEQRTAAADAALNAAREERKDQQERDRARAAMDRLDAEEPDIAAARTELDRARAAEALRPVIAATARAESALASAAEAERAARVAWDALGVEADVSAPSLQKLAAALTRESGAWQRAGELEASAAAREAELDTAAGQVETASARAAEIDDARAELPTRLAGLTEQRDTARRDADRAQDLAVALEAAKARHAAVIDVERLSGDLASAERALAEASTAHAHAQSALATLRQRRLDGFAGELASALAEAQPCPVCGSREHPAPAEHADPVSADDIAAAEAVRDTAAQAERAASDRCAELRAELAVATSRAEGRTAERAERELAAAVAEHDASLAATERRLALDEELEELAARIERLERERTDVAAALAAAREHQAVLAERDAEARALIAEARGAFDSVAERLDHASAQIAAAGALAEALMERQRRAGALTEARAEQDAALAASVFDDVESAQEALREPSQQATLETRISAHAVQREKERAILFELELRTLPEEPIDVAPLEQAAAAARAAWVSAVDEASRANGVAQRLAALIESAASEHARTAEEAAEFEVIRGLADTIAGRGANTRKMTLETFVLAAELEEIVEAANRRLGDMSTGRYQLRHSDALAARGAASGLGIVVFDAFTGQTRPAQSLSGGETFLSSLALALGLAEVVTARAGGIRLDTLFIDEGFGSLDGDTLDIAMRTLDELRQGGRTVGVISHVEAMQEQIPAQLRVRATPEGPSVIETR